MVRLRGTCPYAGGAASAMKEPSGAEAFCGFKIRESENLKFKT